MWFLLLMGACFVVFARPFGRALGNGLEGPWTSEQRATDVRRHTLAARLFGVGLIAFAVWQLLGL
jgi:hypothetical protein